jgi:hypothetical protein
MCPFTPRFIHDQNRRLHSHRQPRLVHVDHLPETYPTFDPARRSSSAKHYGFDFALAMIKLRSYNGPSRFWQLKPSR